MKTLLFARNLRHAKVDYLQHLSPDDRKRVIVITSQRDEERARGQHNVAFCFLDGWWLDWNPVDAYEAYELWPILYGAVRIWEVDDAYRANHARGLMHLPRVNRYYTRFDPREEKTHDDRWLLSDQRDRFVNLKRKPGTDALPGLDDKRGSKNPVGGVVFSEIFDIDDPDSAYPLYADWFIRRHIRQPEPYIKEPIRARDNISAALDWFRFGYTDVDGLVVAPH